LSICIADSLSESHTLTICTNHRQDLGCWASNFTLCTNL